METIKKPFQCEFCPKTFGTSSYLSQHRRIHLDIKPFKCGACEKKFTQMSHLQQHTRTHTGEKPYHCVFPGCNKNFTQLANLRTHGRSHEIEKQHRCHNCHMSFFTQSALMAHVPKHQKTNHQKFHVCLFCGKSYHQQYMLNKHLQRYHLPHRGQPSTMDNTHIQCSTTIPTQTGYTPASPMRSSISSQSVTTSDVALAHQLLSLSTPQISALMEQSRDYMNEGNNVSVQPQLSFARGTNMECSATGMLFGEQTDRAGVTGAVTVQNPSNDAIQVFLENAVQPATSTPAVTPAVRNQGSIMTAAVGNNGSYSTSSSQLPIKTTEIESAYDSMLLAQQKLFTNAVRTGTSNNTNNNRLHNSATISDMTLTQIVFPHQIPFFEHQNRNVDLEVSMVEHWPSPETPKSILNDSIANNQHLISLANTNAMVQMFDLANTGFSDSRTQRSTTTMSSLSTTVIDTVPDFM